VVHIPRHNSGRRWACFVVCLPVFRSLDLSDIPQVISRTGPLNAEPQVPDTGIRYSILHDLLACLHVLRVLLMVSLICCWNIVPCLASISYTLWTPTLEVQSLDCLQCSQPFVKIDENTQQFGSTPQWRDLIALGKCMERGCSRTDARAHFCGDTTYSPGLIRHASYMLTNATFWQPLPELSSDRCPTLWGLCPRYCVVLLTCAILKWLGGLGQRNGLKSHAFF
jgi:hypothetical protein